MNDNQPTRKGNDLLYWLVLIALAYLAWPTISQGHVVAQPIQPQPIIINQAPALPTPIDCLAAIRTVPKGWEEGIGGPEPECWSRWSQAQRIEFLNYVQKAAHK